MSLAYTSGLALAALLAWAAGAKALRPSRTAADFRALGLPNPQLLAVAVPALELVVAALLVGVPWLGGVAALALLAAFSVILGERLREGATAPCGCFGSNSDQPISGVELLRNALLGLLAVAAVVVDDPTKPHLADVIAVTTALAVGAMVLGLAGVKRDVGAVWDNTLAGEVTEEQS